MPTNLRDIATDGAIAQLDIDSIAATARGPIERIEFSGPEPRDNADDALVDVRVHHASSKTRETTGTRVALIQDGIWKWRTVRVNSFDVPELYSEEEATELHVKAARTLFGNAPIYLAPHNEELVSVVALNGTPAQGDVRRALINGISNLPFGANTVRAITAYAASRGLPCELVSGEKTGEQRISVMTEHDPITVTLSDGSAVDVNGGLSFHDTLADGYLTSKEHQLLFHGRFPEAKVSPDLRSGWALIQAPNHQPFEAQAQVIATVKGGQATWAWADSALKGSPSAQAADKVRAFALDNGIPQLLRPVFDEAELDDILVAVKPILNMWTHATASLNEETSCFVVMRAPEFMLPLASQAAVDATLKDLPTYIDAERARAAYASHRGLTFGAGGELTA